MPEAEDALHRAVLTSRVRVTFRGHTAAVWGIVQPDGTRLATTSFDRTAKVWDAASSTELFTLKGHTKAVNGIAFSPDGKRLATASGDKTVQVYALDINELIKLAKERVIHRLLTAEECEKYLQVKQCPPTP